MLIVSQLLICTIAAADTTTSPSATEDFVCTTNTIIIIATTTSPSTITSAGTICTHAPMARIVNTASTQALRPPHVLASSAQPPHNHQHFYQHYFMHSYHYCNHGMCTSITSRTRSITAPTTQGFTTQLELSWPRTTTRARVLEHRFIRKSQGLFLLEITQSWSRDTAPTRVRINSTLGAPAPGAHCALPRRRPNRLSR